eukprot:9459789-Pyramimonas_sp.AAC.4
MSAKPACSTAAMSAPFKCFAASGRTKRSGAPDATRLSLSPCYPIGQSWLVSLHNDAITTKASSIPCLFQGYASLRHRGLSPRFAFEIQAACPYCHPPGHSHARANRGGVTIWAPIKDA